MSQAPPYRPLSAGQRHRLAMGLRPLEWAAWLEVDDSREAELAEKARLLAEVPDTVVAVRDAGLAPSAELLGEVRRWLAEQRPDLEVVLDEGEHPIRAAARLVQEDLCVLVRSDAWRLEAACVCFPSRWRLAAKIGQTLDTIHDPIPGYEESLARPTTATFDRLTPERSFWRLNWTLLDRADLHQPESARDSVETPVPDWFFRVERQTLRALPETGAVVFTIRTYVTALSKILEEDPGFRDTLIEAIESAPAAMAAYKGWRGVAERLAAFPGAASDGA